MTCKNTDDSFNVAAVPRRIDSTKVPPAAKPPAAPKNPFASIQINSIAPSKSTFSFDLSKPMPFDVGPVGLSKDFF